MIAHIAGVPVEEALPALVGGVGAGLFLELTSIPARVRRLRRPRRDRTGRSGRRPSLANERRPDARPPARRWGQSLKMTRYVAPESVAKSSWEDPPAAA
jgi:hypothetical protein